MIHYRTVTPFSWIIFLICFIKNLYNNLIAFDQQYCKKWHQLFQKISSQQHHRPKMQFLKNIHHRSMLKSTFFYTTLHRNSIKMNSVSPKLLKSTFCNIQWTGKLFYIFFTNYLILFHFSQNFEFY